MLLDRESAEDLENEARYDANIYGGVDFITDIEQKLFTEETKEETATTEDAVRTEVV